MLKSGAPGASGAPDAPDVLNPMEGTKIDEVIKVLNARDTSSAAASKVSVDDPSRLNLVFTPPSAAGDSISYTREKPFLIFSKLKLVLTGKTEVGPSSRRKINQKVVDKILDIIALIPVDVF